MFKLLKNIRKLHKFKPSIEFWVDNKTGKSKVYKLYCETWYGEDSQIFVEGILIITKFKYRLHPVSLHLRILWWQEKATHVSYL